MKFWPNRFTELGAILGLVGPVCFHRTPKNSCLNELHLRIIKVGKGDSYDVRGERYKVEA